MTPEVSETLQQEKTVLQKKSVQGVPQHPETTSWSTVQKVGFRFLFIFFAIQIIPLDWKFYRDLFTADSFYDWFNITRYLPRFLTDIPQWGFLSFANWLLIAAVTAVGAALWSSRDKLRTEYNDLYYWFRVGLRYRLAVGIIAYGFAKLFVLQMPYPSLSNLHTAYGDFLPWKIYWHTIGITQGYESFLGAVEILAGILLFYRRTVTFGAGIIIGFTGNVLAANFAYDGGEHVYSAFLVLMAIILFVHDVPRLWNAFALERFTRANKYNPVFYGWMKKLRTGLQVSFVLFILVFGTYAAKNSLNDPYLIPSTPGLKGTYGYYNVREFKLNNVEIPYSTTDPNRWQNVVFEKWATISIKIARPVKLDLTNGEGDARNDIDRDYEVAGVGGRHYYSYKSDTARQILSLENKNDNHKGELFTLEYSRPDSKTIVLKGVNEKGDSVYAVLDRIDKKYMLYEGRRKPVKL